MTFKEQVHAHCLHIIAEKIKLLRNNLRDLRESAANETKSTAGDKYETALAMLQIDQANLMKQLDEISSQQSLLERIDPTRSGSVVVPGSFIKTNRGNLYIAIALGKQIVNNQPVIVLSPQSPLGKQLMGLKTGDSISLNKLVYAIENVI